MRFLLVHSPLVGPSTWRWVAGVLVADGHDATVPDLRAAACRGEPGAVVDAVVADAADEPTVVVGHSGAGWYLPHVAERLGDRSRALVFVDAGIPPAANASTPAGDFLPRLRELATDGWLPAWSTWWGAGAMARLVPDDDRRAHVEAELPEVPLALYESEVRVPSGWRHTAAAYLLLSEAYREDAGAARSLGWPVAERAGSHLDLVNQPGAIARAIVELAATAVVLHALRSGELQDIRTLLHPYVHWTTASGERLRGRRLVLDRLDRLEHPVAVAPPSSIEFRDAQVYRWVEPRSAAP